MLGKIAVTVAPTDANGNPVNVPVSVTLKSINGAPPGPNADLGDFVEYLAPSPEPNAPLAYISSSNTVGDVMVFEFSAPSGSETITDQIVLTVVGQVLLDPQYRAIGMATVAWAHLEDRLHGSMGAVLGIKKEMGRRVAARLRRTDSLLAVLLVAVADKLNATDSEEWSQLIGTIGGLAEKRNEYVHAFWWPASNSSLAKGDLKTRVSPKVLGEVAFSDIEKLASDMDKANVQIIAFLKKHNLQAPA